MANHFRQIRFGGCRAQIALDREVFTDFPETFSTITAVTDLALTEGYYAEIHRSGGRDGKRRKAADRSRRAARKSRGKV